MEIGDRVNTLLAKELLKILEEPFHHQGNRDIARGRQAENNQYFKLLRTIWTEQWPKMGEKDAHRVRFFVTTAFDIPAGPLLHFQYVLRNAFYRPSSASWN